MRILAVLTLLVLVCGCKTTSFTQTLASGGTLTFSDTRWFWQTTANIKGTVNPTNGLIVFDVQAESNVNTETLKAIAEGVAKGLAGAVKP